MGVWSKLMAGVAGFRQGWLNADTLRTQSGLNDFDVFIQWEARQFRYDLFWSFYQNNTFQELAHSWSRPVRQAFALYQYTRHLFNPVYRLGEFWATHLMGGMLDPEAGDGEQAQSALPIDTKNSRIRPALGQLWHDSRWQGTKEVWTRYGAVLGDAGLQVIDDPQSGKVFLRVIHPGHIKWLERDDAGCVRSYIIEEVRYDPRMLPIRNLNPLIDPRSLRRTVRYNEEAFLDGNEVVYRTYLNGALFDWRGSSGDGQELPPEWRVPYPMIPLVCVPHQAIGLDFGMAEPHAMISKIFEVDDLASNVGDYVRKSLNAPWLYAGVAPPDPAKGSPRTRGATPTDGNPQPGRTEVRSLYTADPNAKATALVYPLEIDAVNVHIKELNQAIERDYPELQVDLLTTTGESSGRAIRQARQRTEAKVQARRAGYDDALCQVQAMALAIGGVRGYPGYEGFSLADLAGRRLEHRIGHRPVFAVDPLDTIEEDQAFWDAANKAVTAGLPLDLYLRRNGWSEQDLAELSQAREQEAAAQVDQIKSQQQALGGSTLDDEDTVPAEAA